MESPECMDSPADMDSPAYMESPDYDRNPSPPPELAEHPELLRAESIGNTAFSKHWLFTTLIKLIEEVDRENEEESNLAVDVDEELQNELCKLWDMSMNSEVAKFLNEFKAVQILTGTIEKSKPPRVIEICVGILGNMACEQTVCKQMSENIKFIDLVLFLLETRDVPTLVENTRLIYTSLSNTGSRGPWILAVQRSEDVLGHLKFIFQSSTNCDLLKNTAELVDTLLDLEPDLCVSWATIEFIHSLLEATEQIGSSHSEALEVYLHIFQSFSTTESGVEALVEHIDKLEGKIIKYLNIVCEYEIVGLEGKEGPLSSALSVLNILLTAQPVQRQEHLCKDEKIIRILLKILEPLYPILQRYRAAEQTSSNEPISGGKTDHVPSSDQSDAKTVNGSINTVEDTKESISTERDKDDTKVLDENEKAEFRQLEVLYDILSAYLVDYCNIAFVDSSAKSEKTLKDNNSTVDSETKLEVSDDTYNSDSTAESSPKGSNCNEADGLAAERSPKGSNCNDPDGLAAERSPKGNNCNEAGDLAAERSPKGSNCNEAGDLAAEGSPKGSNCNELDSSAAERSPKGNNSNEPENSDCVSKAISETSENNVTENSSKDKQVKLAADGDTISELDHSPDYIPAIDCVPILTYLDDACSRWRLNNLGLCLKESDNGRLLFDRLYELANSNVMERLCRILTDINEGRIVNRTDSHKESTDDTVS